MAEAIVVIGGLAFVAVGAVMMRIEFHGYKMCPACGDETFDPGIKVCPKCGTRIR